MSAHVYVGDQEICSELVFQLNIMKRSLSSGIQKIIIHTAIGRQHTTAVRSDAFESVLVGVCSARACLLHV